MIAPLKLNEEYWTEFSTEQADIEFIYTLLLEKEIPLTTEELLKELVCHRITKQLESIQQQSRENGEIYLPKDAYKKGDKLTFPAFDMQSGKVTSLREGFNPEYENLKVIEVKMDSGEVKSFASNLQEHALNTALEISEDDPNLNPDSVLEKYHDFLRGKLSEALKDNDDLVKTGGN